jgi:hypothetical protein
MTREKIRKLEVLARPAAERPQRHRRAHEHGRLRRRARALAPGRGGPIAGSSTTGGARAPHLDDRLAAPLGSIGLERASALDRVIVRWRANDRGCRHASSPVASATARTSRSVMRASTYAAVELQNVADQLTIRWPLIRRVVAEQPMDLELERVEPRARRRTAIDRRSSARSARRTVLRSSPNRRASSLIDTRRTKCSRRQLGPGLRVEHRSLRLDPDDQAGVRTTPDATDGETSQGGKSQPANRGEYSRRADKRSGAPGRPSCARQAPTAAGSCVMRLELDYEPHPGRPRRSRGPPVRRRILFRPTTAGGPEVSSL